MKVSGIICEYNPFHNGHARHIAETRRNGATHIVCVMSGGFVQRGDVAIMDKLARARLAVRSGADLVIELPVQYCLAPAEKFAEGAVWLLHSLGAVDELSFGSECGDISRLAHAMITSETAAVEYNEEIKSIMEKGYTYPRALSSVINGMDPEAAAVISEPNNLLAIEYLRALRSFSSPMRPFTVKRDNAGHDSPVPEDGMASASYIREQISSGNDISTFTTPLWAEAVQRAINAGKTADITRLERVLLYKLRTSSPEEIAGLFDVGQGLENRIYGARMSGSLEELLYAVKTKRYTMARIRRILLSLLIGVNRQDMTHMPPYGRILAFNEGGREILARAKDRASIPFGSSLAKLSQKNRTARRFAELEAAASDIYGLALDTITSSQEDLRAKIQIDME
ncbi:MAG TPA: nucleotidyltransferase [Ruminococcus sp.]|nr:nucleotidyltransferase [Ruminococcus sp.]